MPWSVEVMALLLPSGSEILGWPGDKAATEVVPVLQKIHCSHFGQVRRHSATDPLHLHCPMKRKFLSHLSQKAKKYQVGSVTGLMVERYIPAKQSTICAVTHIWLEQATSNLPSTIRSNQKCLVALPIAFRAAMVSALLARMLFATYEESR